MKLAAYYRRFGLNRLTDPILKATTSLRRFAFHADLLIYSTVLMLIAGGAAALALNKVETVFNADIADAKDPIEVKRMYLGQADYAVYLPTLARLNPGVGFALGQDGTSISLTIADEELFPDFLMAMHTLQAFKPSVAWELVEICAKKCSDEQIVARAVVKGFTQEIYKP